MFFVRPSMRLIKLIPQENFISHIIYNFAEKKKVLILSREDKMLKFFEINMFHMARFVSYCRELPGRIDPLYEVLALNFETGTLRHSGFHSGVQLGSLSNDQ